MQANNKGLSFITIMVIIAILALILRFAVERILEITIQQNDSNAQATIKLISVALENYARDHQGTFPGSLSVLTQNNPPYLDKDYIVKSPLKGYEYSCSRLEASGYSCSATPIKCKISGRTVYMVSTGDLVVSEICSPKE
jgi:type II secretory pathway pseudopilin PulG